MKFPLLKSSITSNDSEHGFLNSYEHATEIPLLPHPGAFSKVRKNHIHEGIDLYCQEGDPVIAMESGVIVNIKAFTGDIAGSPWWNNTWAVLIKSPCGVLNYGEIQPSPHWQIGDTIQEGEIIGHVVTVLKKDKGRPRSMLHLEYYEEGTIDSIPEWPLNTLKPLQLKDPTHLLTPFLTK